MLMDRRHTLPTLRLVVLSGATNVASVVLIEVPKCQRLSSSSRESKVVVTLAVLVLGSD
jgi:hypothetical protein